MAGVPRQPGRLSTRQADRQGHARGGRTRTTCSSPAASWSRPETSTSSRRPTPSGTRARTTSSRPPAAAPPSATSGTPRSTTSSSRPAARSPRPARPTSPTRSRWRTPSPTTPSAATSAASCSSGSTTRRSTSWSSRPTPPRRSRRASTSSTAASPASPWTTTPTVPAPATVAPFTFNEATVTVGGVASTTHLQLRGHDHQHRHPPADGRRDPLRHRRGQARNHVRLRHDLRGHHRVQQLPHRLRPGTTQANTVFTATLDFDFSHGVNNSLQITSAKAAYEEFPVEPDAGGDPIVVPSAPATSAAAPSPPSSRTSRPPRPGRPWTFPQEAEELAEHGCEHRHRGEGRQTTL